MKKKIHDQYFIDIVNQNKTGLYREAYSYLQNAADAEDAVSNTILKAYEKIETLKDMAFKVIIFSNATKRRIKPFKDVLNVDALARAGKPSKKNFLKVIKMFNYNLSEVTIVGDQLYKDILGGNKTGIKTILVNPMSNDDMFLTTLIFRPLERIKYKELAKKGLLIKGKYYE